MRWARLSLAAVLFVQSGCVSFYSGVPKHAPVPSARDTVLYYRLPDFRDMFGNARGAIEYFFQHESGFVDAKSVTQIPDHGLFCDVNIQWRTPSPGAVIFGYISYLTLTVVPAWSLHEGYAIDYILYKDGKLVRKFRYDITRKDFLWIVFLPFLWVNLVTMDQQQAIKYVSRQFIHDAAPILNGT